MHDKPLNILYEDNHLLAVDKIALLATQPSEDHKVSLEGLAKEWIRLKYHKEGNVYLHATHRLDRVTSGIVLFAKTSKALSRMQELMREKKVEKYYKAQVAKAFSENEGTFEDYLIHDDYKAEVVSKDQKEAKHSFLTFKVVKRNKEATLLEICLKTGRYHQIRAQMAHRHFPILGDSKYGSTVTYPDGHIDLHHYKMIFIHPVTHKQIEITSPSPF